jgi:hypothetical protein
LNARATPLIEIDASEIGSEIAPRPSRQQPAPREPIGPTTAAERLDGAIGIVADPQLTATAKNVGVALISFMNWKTGECFPNMEKIATRAAVSKKTALTGTKLLEQSGWFWIERDEGGDRDSNRYHLAIERVRAAQTSPSEEFHGVKITPCSEVHGVIPAPSMVKNPPVHGVNFTPKHLEDNSSKRTPDAADAAPPDQERELFRRGKEVLGQNAGGLISNLLKVKGRIELARAAIETAATKQAPREYIGAVIRGRNALGKEEQARLRGDRW